MDTVPVSPAERRPAGAAARAVRSRAHGWRFRVAGVPRHRVAAAQARNDAGDSAAHDRPAAHLRPDLHSDPGRTGLCYRNRQLVYLPHGIPFFQFWLRRRDVVSRARTHDCFRQVADARNAGAARLEMKSAIKYLLALLALAAAVAPIYWLVTISIKRDIDQFAVPPLWFHFQPTARHYMESFRDGDLARSLWNSTFVASLSTLLAMLLGVPAAYGLERLRWPLDWNQKIGFWILSTRMLPPI